MTRDIINDDVIAKAQQGNTEAINLIIKEYKKLIFLNIQNYFVVGAEKEDLLQEGTIGLLKAIQNYRKGKSSFKTFATICIRRQIISVVRTSCAQKNSALNSASGNNLESENGEVLYPGSLVVSSKNNPEKIVLSKEKLEEFQSFVDEKFSPFEQLVFSYMIQGFSYREIASKLNKKPKTIDNSFQRIKKKSELWLNTY